MADRSFLDWPFFEDRHRRLADKLEQWCSQNLSKSDHHHTVDESCKKLVARLGEDGWLQHAVPANTAGAPGRFDVRALALIRETLARYDALADFAFAMQGLGSGAISLFGSQRQKQRYLPAVREGRMIAAFALTEPEAGSDLAAIATEARRAGDGYLLNGAKTFISNGGIADFYVVLARTGEAPGAQGLSMFIVGADTPGLEVVERIEVVAPHPLARLSFEAVGLGQDALLGEAGRGFVQAMATLDVFRTTVGAAALGLARRALDEATTRSLSRKLGDGVLADSPVTQSALADMALEIDSAALLVYRAAWLRDTQDGRISREAAMAKLAATENAQMVIDRAVQMFGGLGVTKGVPVEALYREIRALRIYEGASEVQKLIIARAHLKDYAA